MSDQSGLGPTPSEIANAAGAQGSVAVPLPLESVEPTMVGPAPAADAAPADADPAALSDAARAPVTPAPRPPLSLETPVAAPAAPAAAPAPRAPLSLASPVPVGMGPVGIAPAVAPAAAPAAAPAMAVSPTQHDGSPLPLPHRDTVLDLSTARPTPAPAAAPDDDDDEPPAGNRPGNAPAVQPPAQAAPPANMGGGHGGGGHGGGGQPHDPDDDDDEPQPQGNRRWAWLVGLLIVALLAALAAFVFRGDHSATPLPVAGGSGGQRDAGVVTPTPVPSACVEYDWPAAGTNPTGLFAENGEGAPGGPHCDRPGASMHVDVSRRVWIACNCN